VATPRRAGLPDAQERQQPVTDKRKIIQIGLGGWGWSWVNIVRTSAEWELAAVVDIDADRLKAAAGQFGLSGEQLHGSLESAITATKADACLVVVPPEAHAPVTIAAVRAGLHCLVEKPIADTVAAAKAMVAGARDHGVTLMVNQNYRYRRAAATLRKLMTEGTIGDVGTVYINFQKAAHFGGGFREKMAHPLVLDMAIHHFDQLRGLVGFEPVEVRAQSWNPPWSWFAGDPVANAVFTAQNGATAVYTGSWVSQGWQTTWDGDWRIQAREGEIHWKDNQIRLLPTSVFTSVFVPGARERDGWLDVDLIPMDVEDRLATLREFARAIAEKREPLTSGADNLRTLTTVLATCLSIERGEPVTLAEVLS
jgi:predicted dehydrogenase